MYHENIGKLSLLGSAFAYAEIRKVMVFKKTSYSMCSIAST